jgi:pimeloyl-ACP methyl ester carboxylesterase
MRPELKQKHRKRRWFIYAGIVIVLFIALTFIFDFFPEEEKRLRQGLRETVVKTFPEQAGEVARTFGLIAYAKTSDIQTEVDPATPSVVLIHGLDDPGKVWMNLAPALDNHGYAVWIMRYPNDQPIVDSASLFFNELNRFKARGASTVTVVAHSMGGLVTRELLTSPQLSYTAALYADQIPKITALIMVGTPNYGSEIARLRLFGEIRDQWVNMMEGNGHWLRAIMDGAGEAKIDLLPDSLFLSTLNARPLPSTVQMFIIAGIASPWDDKDIDRFIGAVRKKSPGNQQENIGKLENFLNSVTDGLGDGLVTVESTRLPGVPHQTVRGTHLSMIRNISIDSQRIPPAVPIIIEHLQSIFN